MIYIRTATLCMKNIEQTQEIQEEKQKENIKETQTTINYKGERELRKEGRQPLVVSSHTQDQSKRVPLKEARI